MKKILQDILDEIKQFVNGKTIDALIPPLVYLVANHLFELKIAVFISIATAIIINLENQLQHSRRTDRDIVVRKMADGYREFL